MSCVRGSVGETLLACQSQRKGKKRGWVQVKLEGKDAMTCVALERHFKGRHFLNMLVVYGTKTAIKDTHI